MAKQPQSVESTKDQGPADQRWVRRLKRVVATMPTHLSLYVTNGCIQVISTDRMARIPKGDMAEHSTAVDDNEICSIFNRRIYPNSETL